MTDDKIEDGILRDLFKGFVGESNYNGEKKYVVGIRKAWIYVTEEQLHDIHKAIHEVLGLDQKL